MLSFSVYVWFFRSLHTTSNIIARSDDLTVLFKLDSARPLTSTYSSQWQMEFCKRFVNLPLNAQSYPFKFQCSLLSVSYVQCLRLFIAHVCLVAVNNITMEPKRNTYIIHLVPFRSHTRWYILSQLSTIHNLQSMISIGQSKGPHNQHIETTIWTKESTRNWNIYRFVVVANKSLVII